MDYSKFEGMTPGPWIIKTNSDPMLVTENGEFIATVYGDKNKLAIAALPELIEENKRLRKALENITDICDEDAEILETGGKPIKYAIKRARAALKGK
jgi:hypothetical protein